METETHRQRPVLIIGALSVQGPRAAQAGAGGREEREGHLANTFYWQSRLDASPYSIVTSLFFTLPG